MTKKKCRKINPVGNKRTEVDETSVNEIDNKEACTNTDHDGQ